MKPIVADMTLPDIIWTQWHLFGKVLQEQALLNNNGMITSTFELLQDVRAKINSDLMADNAKRDFWLAEAGLKSVVYGGGGAGGGGGDMTVLADAGGPGH